MGGTHTCAVSVSAAIGGATFAGVGFGTAIDGILGSVSVALTPAATNPPGSVNPFLTPLTLLGLPCPVRGSITITLPLAVGTVTLTITAVD